jgi:hypothetical protein
MPYALEEEEEEALTQLLETPYQQEPPINRLKRTDVQAAINRLTPKKSPGYDLITSKIIRAAYYWNQIPYSTIQRRSA